MKENLTTIRLFRRRFLSKSPALYYHIKSSYACVNVNVSSEQSLPLCLLSSSVVSNKGYMFVFMSRIYLCIEYALNTITSSESYFCLFIDINISVVCFVSSFVEFFYFCFCSSLNDHFYVLMAFRSPPEKLFLSRDCKLIDDEVFIERSLLARIWHRKSHCAFFFPRFNDIKSGCVSYRSDLINKIDNKLRMIHGMKDESKWDIYQYFASQIIFNSLFNLFFRVFETDLPISYNGSELGS